jgi:hypothetical protein
MKRWIAACFVAALTLAGAGAQTVPPTKPVDAAAEQKARLAEALKNYHGPEYVRSEAMIPARDGVLLHTVILRPVDSDKSGAPRAVQIGWAVCDEPADCGAYGEDGCR